MGCAGKQCFLDKERTCGDDCTAFNEKAQACKLLERSAGIARAFRVMMSWLGQHDPPKVR